MGEQLSYGDLPGSIRSLSLMESGSELSWEKFCNRLIQSKSPRFDRLENQRGGDGFRDRVNEERIA